MRKGRDGGKKKREKRGKKTGKKRKREKTDGNSGHYVIASRPLGPKYDKRGQIVSHST